MAVVVGEIERVHQADTELSHNLHLLDEQIQACKRIISQLASSAGQHRTESASGAVLDQFIEAIVARARALHPGTTIALQLDAVNPAPRVIAEETLRQAITNVIDNAVQASAEQVDVRATWAEGHLVVEVRDRGPGFTPQSLDHLGRHVGSTKSATGGLGMGLMLCATALERLGGRLEPANHPQGGACVRLTVPLHAILINKP
jgi:two-component system sensor histidine kinase RegB